MSDPIRIADPTSLYRLSHAVLEGVARALNLTTLPSGGAPSRRYVAVGDPAFDCCPQLTVHASNIRMTPTYVDNNGYRIGPSEYLVDMNVVLLRCFPTGAEIAAADLDGVSEILYMDAALMYWKFECALLNGQVPEVASTGCTLYAPGLMNPVTPQAGCGGWQWTWTFVIPS